MLSRQSAIESIFCRHGDEAIYVTNTGYISRAVFKEYPLKKNIFYMQGSASDRTLMTEMFSVKLKNRTTKDV